MWHREQSGWHSPSLGRWMDLLVYGHGGAPLLAFPSATGRYFDWEGFGLVGALGEHVARGWVQLVCVDSVDRESWYGHASPHDKARRHDAYDRYLLHEVVPFIRSRNGNPFLITAGPSFGAYHAVNFGLRHPGLVRRVIGMSGPYDIRFRTGGYTDGLVYVHNPCEFVRHEQDPGRLAALRSVDIILAVGEDDPLRPDNEHLSALLWQRGIGNALRVWWGHAHDWQWWQRMLQRYVGGHD